MVDDDLSDKAAMDGEAVRPIRALLRGLETLQEMNRRSSVTVTDIARAVGLPRTTAYRVLETLCASGVVVRDPADDQYHLTHQIRTLADGFDAEGWVESTAKPALSKLLKDVPWPLAIATLHGTSMLVRAIAESAPNERNVTARAPLLTTSQGRLFLALCGEEQRVILLDLLARSPAPADHLARDKSLMNRIFAEIRNNGWVMLLEGDNPEIDLAVPVLLRNRFLASLSMRFSRAAVPPEQAVEKFLPPLKRAAAEIGTAFEEQPHGAG